VRPLEPAHEDSKPSPALGTQSITHAAWDLDAVHGVHATHSVSTLGTQLLVKLRALGRGLPQLWQDLGAEGFYPVVLPLPDVV
jgi:hypothetical protein